MRPLKPMLAQMAESPREAIEEHGGETAFEYKLDGARIQIHKVGEKVKVFSRRLTDVTDSLPEIVQAVREGVKAHEAVLEGEVIAVGRDGHPLPFQHLMRRFRRVYEIEKMLREIPVKLYLFDLLYVDGESLIDEPYLEITAAEYGYGRRHGWLSDYYLAARDEETGEFLVVGKTFKGLTDQEIIEMTERLKRLAIMEEGNRVVVKPEIVVEVAYNEIQKSPKYKCGMALRFARITRIRDDKSPEEVDTIQKVRKIYEKQFEKKARL
ncbi:hypothetical protein B6U84_02135 [Candidatus Bathyarchaeota archaeon ex4484_40]|nr:MAG: hypothetical protein B6U84_02135 [Candidatus Bathyarchaeota archaeon ex4484_40]